MEILHLARLFTERASANASQTALRYRDYKVGKWKNVTWDEMSCRVDRVAAAMLDAGIKPQDKVAIFSQNKPECLVCETAAYSIRAVAVPLYATSTTAQIDYILRDADISLVFVGEQFQYDRAYEAMQGGGPLRRIVIFDTEVRLHRDDRSSVYFNDFLHKGELKAACMDEVRVLRSQVQWDDMANILYTSGTTGNPKGVIILHSNFREIIRVMNLKLQTILGKNQSSISFLPMTHILEKAWTYYCLMNHIRVDINLRPSDIQMSIKETHPHMMCSVPRFWEKVYAGIQEVLQTFPPMLQKVALYGVKTGRRYHLDYRRIGKRVPPFTFLLYWAYNLTIFNKIKKTVGIENGVLFPTAGAKLSDEVCVFMRSIGIPICYGYGLTESTATVACFDQTGYELGTVGTLVDGLSARIDPENGEILLKGGTITPGYYQRPDVNAEAFTPDGYFRTGDAGYFDEKGNLVLTERLKDLFKTSNGKYISPQNIETALTNDRYIDEACLIGDQRKFVSALIIPAYKELPALINLLGLSDLDASDRPRCLNDSRIVAFFESRIRDIQKDMAGFEQVRRFALLPEPFTMEKGELTNTLKMKRGVINEHYQDIIEKFYE